TLEQAIRGQLVASKTAAEEQLRGIKTQRKSLTDECGVLRINYRTAEAFESSVSEDDTLTWLEQAKKRAPEQVAAVQQRLAEAQSTQAAARQQALATTARLETTDFKIAELEAEIAELDKLIRSAPAAAVEYCNFECQRRRIENEPLFLDSRWPSPPVLSLYTHSTVAPPPLPPELEACPVK
ncbi:TPA: hypothetical protein DIC21_00005, partial [Candidatus Uhrbacteria bacterium]|nr:hypothetical protein [Candidatus Uhrbacteria bacterium]